MNNRLIVFGLGVAAISSPPLFARQQKDERGQGALQQADADRQDAAKIGELTAAVLAAREAASGRDLGPSLRAALAQSLRSLPLERLQAFWSAGGLGDIDAEVRATGNAVGDAAADLGFTPIPPCRIIDTRAPVVGSLVAGTQRSFRARNSGGFASQGGSATDCGIPPTAGAVEMNFVAVGPSGPGDIRAFAYGGALPSASVLNYSNIAGLNVANGIAQPVCNPAGPTPCNEDVTIQADASNTHLVVDVVGYFNKIDKSAVKSMVVSSLKSGAIIPIAAGTCTNGGSVTVNATVAGRIIVRANVELQFNHTLGVYQEVYLNLGTTATDCNSQPAGYSTWATVAGALPTSSDYYPWSNPFAVFDVAAGPHTYYLNANGGGGMVTIYDVGMEATFIPN